jgi:hypothetical protein
MREYRPNRNSYGEIMISGYTSGFRGSRFSDKPHMNKLISMKSQVVFAEYS